MSISLIKCFEQISKYIVIVMNVMKSFKTLNVSSCKYRTGILYNHDVTADQKAKLHTRNLTIKYLHRRICQLKDQEFNRSVQCSGSDVEVARTLLQHVIFQNTSSETQERALIIEEDPLWFKI